ncbi:HAMP domain-containing histidine kinase [Paenibacillus sp. N3/727]|uniref:sensor histidine kinase n=1 Tax=Paenibacillus sp. N3/727 TaxID=2925845 RepID=UPI001F53359A|nr:HAMP domain-containing sensor histidine kinase [Paenibacillus sp. N3/727]UNK19668.1 HAMP domain-containing histidine kinase [Paenibacillus sp. N3/727]
MSEIKEILLQLLFSLTPFVLYNIYYRNLEVNYSRRFIIFTCSFCLILSMTFPLSVQDGLVFDVRYVIIFFGILFGGVTTGFILLVEFIIFRLYIGGSGTLDALIILAITFPLSILLSSFYYKIRKKYWITFIAGISFSIIPIVVLYITKPDYILSNVTFNILAMPVHNCLGIWLLITLFNKSVTDKELYLKVIQNEKVETINQVAASLAHEVRNPLTTVLGFLKLIRANTLDWEKTERFIDISIEEIHRTEQILSDYLSISKPLATFHQHIDLVVQLKTVVEVMTPYANMNNVSLEASYPAAPVHITGNPTEMKQLLVNFIKNAIEASADMPKARVSIQFLQHLRRVQLEIQDNGVGMDEEQMSRLGSIYYSTKSNGTGLGLTFSYQAIRSMNGTISVKSEPYSGTVFTISLPLA